MRYVSRADWDAPAGDPAPSDPFRGPLQTIWVHTGAVRLDIVGDTYEERAHCRSYERTALDRGWTAVGYNALVGQSGTAYVGRGLDRRSGANNGSHNNNALSVCVIGHGDYEPLTADAAATLVAVVEDLIGRHGEPAVVRLAGHREEPTDKSCPGNLVMPWVTDHRDDNQNWTGDIMAITDEDVERIALAVLQRKFTTGWQHDGTYDADNLLYISLQESVIDIRGRVIKLENQQ